MTEDSADPSKHAPASGDLRAQSASASGEGSRGVSGRGNATAQPASVSAKAEIGQVSFVGQGVSAQVEPAGFSGTLTAVSSFDVAGYVGSAATAQVLAKLSSEDRALIEHMKAAHLLPKLPRPQGVTDEMFPEIAAILAKNLRQDHEREREDRHREEARQHDAAQRSKDRRTKILLGVLGLVGVIAALLSSYLSNTN